MYKRVGGHSPQVIFFLAPNLFVCLQEAPKHVFFLTLNSPCTTYLPSYLTLKMVISPNFCQMLSDCQFVFLWSKLVKIFKNLFHAPLNCCYNPINTNTDPPIKKPKAVKDSMVFLRLPLATCITNIKRTLLYQPFLKICLTLSCTVVLACLIGQFGLILWQKSSDGAHFFLVRATKKIKTVLDQKIP